ncbi:MAG: hypothetical protein FJ263_01730 [Planctomycetes bacterium]|nr:hypothetical protein [Planctomycetota bacterium]
MDIKNQSAKIKIKESAGPTAEISGFLTRKEFGMTNKMRSFAARVRGLQVICDDEFNGFCSHWFFHIWLYIGFLGAVF